jgi:hypothetical protein
VEASRPTALPEDHSPIRPISSVLSFLTVPMGDVGDLYIFQEVVSQLGLYRGNELNLELLPL